MGRPSVLGLPNAEGLFTDPETQAFEKRIRVEANDMKLESFGVELCHLIGSCVAQGIFDSNDS